MLKVNELKQGDIVVVNDEGVEREGTVVKVSHEEHQALVNNGVQEFWYSQEDMKPVRVDEKQLSLLGFTSEKTDKGLKFKKDSFRMMIPGTGDFSRVEMWYREDRRHFNHPLNVHELQNLHLDMTKVPLERH